MPPTRAQPAEAERSISTSTGLDIRKTEFAIITKREFYDRFHNRALERLAKARLILKQRDPDRNLEYPVLLLTLDPKIMKDCPGKVLYTRKLEIQENVLTEREPRRRTWATTWFNGVPEPLISNDLTVEQLEKELDGLIDGFILDYTVANRK